MVSSPPAEDKDSDLNGARFGRDWECLTEQPLLSLPSDEMLIKLWELISFISIHLFDDMMQLSSKRLN